MQNISISLLWPKGRDAYSSKINRLSPATIDSLKMDYLCRIMAKNENQAETIKEILVEMCCSEDVIKYRQDIFEDLMHEEKLVTSLEVILKQLENLRYVANQSAAVEDAKLWRLFSKLKELEGYVDCVTGILQYMQGFDLKSKGLNLLRETVMNICEDKEFKALSDTVKQLAIEINEVQSITLGINLDTSLNPVEATLVSVNKAKFKDNSWLNVVLSSANGLKAEEFGYVSKIHRLSEDKRDPIMYNLYRDIEKILKPVLRDLSSGLNRYTNICGSHLVNIIPEITFYLSFNSLFKRLKENGMPLCKPAIANIKDRECIINNLYSINLAFYMLHQKDKPAENIILNNVKFDESGRIFILTGPNRGGKTVYTEAVGMANVLFQAGAFVPGTYALISPSDSIFTHFPVDENQTVALGRLGEETKRFNEIFEKATKYSWVLLNESLASTSFLEGLYIAKDIVKALRYLGARVIYNTHMHELAVCTDAINSEVSGDSRVISLVAGLAEGKRSYMIRPGAPLGKSYAMDIAVKYGISFEQIIETIDRKEINSSAENS